MTEYVTPEEFDAFMKTVSPTDKKMKQKYLAYIAALPSKIPPPEIRIAPTLEQVKSWLTKEEYDDILVKVGGEDALKVMLRGG